MSLSKPIYQHLPNTITMMSLVSGCTAIIFTFHSSLLPLAPWLIVLSALFDFLDGFSARLLKAYSELGKQLDSLADAVSFGVAPSMISFQLIYQNILRDQPGFGIHNLSLVPLVMLLPALLFPVFSVIRLARFNIDTTQYLSFKGLPTPGSALFIVFLALSLMQSESSVYTQWLHSQWSFPVVLVLLSYLMISPVRMLSLKFSSWNLRENYLKYLLLLSALFLIPLMGIGGCLLTMAVYLVLSVIFHFTNQNAN